MRTLPQRGMLAIIITIAVVVFDQVSKAIVINNLELYGEAGFIPHIISFYHTRNTGAAFSSFSDKPWVFMVLSFAAMAATVFVLIKEYRRHRLLTVSLAMILGGGIGNMIDRIGLGYVTDFLRFDFVDFAIFNVADSFITVGAVLLGVYILVFEPKVEKRLKAASSDEGTDPGDKQKTADESGNPPEDGENGGENAG